MSINEKEKDGPRQGGGNPYVVENIIAGTINLVSDTHFTADIGAHWSTVSTYTSRRATTKSIEFCVENGLQVLEPGAGGGEFKFLQGFNPFLVNSVHTFNSPVLQKAVSDFLQEEREYNQELKDFLLEVERGGRSTYEQIGGLEVLVFHYLVNDMYNISIFDNRTLHILQFCSNTSQITITLHRDFQSLYIPDMERSSTLGSPCKLLTQAFASGQSPCSYHQGHEGTQCNPPTPIVQFIESLQHAFAFSSALKLHPHALASVLIHIKASIFFTFEAAHAYD